MQAVYCILISSTPVVLALYDCDVPGSDVRQPALNLLRPHQAQACRHDNEQGPLLLRKPSGSRTARVFSSQQGMHRRRHRQQHADPPPTVKR
jgi:hypothetical protein